jgi:zinc protease
MKYYVRLILLFFCFSAHAKILDIQHWKTSKGTPVYFVQTQHVPVLVIEVAFDAGSARDEQLPGIAALVNALMNEGNAGLSATELAEGFETIGAQYNHTLDRDKSLFMLRTMTEQKKLDSSLSFFTKIFQPDFPTSAFKREKKQQEIAIKQMNESPNAVAQKALLKAIYPHHPYGHPILGTTASVEKIQLSDINTFHKKYYNTQNAMITLSGAIDLKTAKALAEQITQVIPEGKGATTLPEAMYTDKTVRENIAYPSAQTIILLGQVGINHHSPDYFPLNVGNYSLGGGMLVSRLSDEIREKRGLAYNVTSGFNPLQANGPFVISLATRTEKAAEALKVTEATINKFLSKGLTKTELIAAKRFIKGNFPMRFETNADIASVLLTIGQNHLPLDYLDTYLAQVDAVTVAQIKTAFDKHIHPNKIITVGQSKF